MTLSDEQIVETLPDITEHQRHNESECLPIDHNHLAKYTMGDAELQYEVLQLFIEQLPSLISQLRAAASEKDWYIAAHTLKGSARAVGAHALGELAADAEKSAPDWGSFDLQPLQDNSEVVTTYIATLAA